MYHIRMYLVSACRRTFRPWTHTSDDSYMYQLSLVVATLLYLTYIKIHGVFTSRVALQITSVTSVGHSYPYTEVL